MFSLACNLSVSRKFKLRDRVSATRSDQIREQVVQTTWNIFILKNYKNGISKWPDVNYYNQRCQVICHCGVDKLCVSFRYQLKHLCDVLIWSVSLSYQLVRHYDVSNWSVLFKNRWDVTKTSQIGPTNWRTSYNAVMMSHYDLGSSN